MKHAPWLPVWITVVTVLAVFLAVSFIWPSVPAPAPSPSDTASERGGGRIMEPPDAGNTQAAARHDAAPEPVLEETAPDSAMSRRLREQQRQESPEAGPPLSGISENSETEVKTAYLTFDDGPSANTDAILDILGRSGVKATFFVIGRESEEAARQYRRIVEEGHQLGNHTYSHDYRRLYTSVEGFIADTEKLNRMLQEITGIRPHILRFPGGSNHRLGEAKRNRGLMPGIIRRLEREGYRYFDWNVSSTDAARTVQPKDEIVGAVLGSSRGKQQAVIIMHDVAVKKTTVEALPEVIRGLREQGFRFDTLNERLAFSPQFLRP